MKRYRWLGLFCSVIGVLLSCYVLAVAPLAGAETPVVVTNWPTPVPYPTQIPYPTRCATPPVWASSSPEPVCGLAAVSVAHVNGERGYDLAIIGILIAGFGFLGVLQLVQVVVRR